MSDRQLTVQQQEAIRWAKALRSGKYKQTYGHVRTEYGFVCAVGAYYAEAGIDSDFEFVAYNMFGESFVNLITTMNDHGAKFAELADIIEEKFLCRS